MLDILFKLMTLCETMVAGGGLVDCTLWNGICCGGFDSAAGATSKSVCIGDTGRANYKCGSEDYVRRSDKADRCTIVQELPGSGNYG